MVHQKHIVCALISVIIFDPKQLDKQVTSYTGGIYTYLPLHWEEHKNQ